MKRTIFAAAAVVLMAITAQAEPFTKLYSSDPWNVWHDASNDDGNPMCTMDAEFAGANGWAYVKWTARGGAFLQVWKFQLENAQRLDGADVDNIDRLEPRCSAATNDHCQSETPQ